MKEHGEKTIFYLKSRKWVGIVLSQLCVCFSAVSIQNWLQAGLQEISRYGYYLVFSLTCTSLLIYKVFYNVYFRAGAGSNCVWGGVVTKDVTCLHAALPCPNSGITPFWSITETGAGKRASSMPLSSLARPSPSSAPMAGATQRPMGVTPLIYFVSHYISITLLLEKQILYYKSLLFPFCSWGIVVQSHGGQKLKSV